MKTRRALGRGLDALLGAEPGAASASQRDYFSCGIEDLHPTHGQPRQRFDEARLAELAESIRQKGVIQPLAVRRRPEGGYYIIVGERRWRAAQRAGLREVPVVVREETPSEAFLSALIENLQREDLNPIEEAEAYRRLIDEFGHTQEGAAQRVGKDRSTVANALRLLRLPDAVRANVVRGTLSMGHARALLGLEDPKLMEAAARRVVGRGLSVRATEALVRRSREGKVPPDELAKEEPKKTVAVRDLESRLSRSLATRVRLITGRGGKGHIEIQYSSLDELDRLLEKLF